MAEIVFKIIGTVAATLFSCVNVGWLIYTEIPKIGNETIRVILIVVLVLIGLFFIVAAIYNIGSTVSNRRKKHKLRINSRRFYRFFSKWYRKKGHLNIVCDDLEWTNEKIMTVLKNKKHQLTLFVAENHTYDETVVELKNNGACIKTVKKDIVDKYSFSYVNCMGNSFHIILRDKALDKNNYVKFEEIHNSALINLMKYLIEKEEA